jgi:hypothetical protein
MEGVIRTTYTIGCKPPTYMVILWWKAAWLGVMLMSKKWSVSAIWLFSASIAHGAHYKKTFQQWRFDNDVAGKHHELLKGGKNLKNNDVPVKNVVTCLIQNVISRSKNLANQKTGNTLPRISPRLQSQPYKAIIQRTEYGQKFPRGIFPLAPKDFGPTTRATEPAKPTQPASLAKP